MNKTYVKNVTKRAKEAIYDLIAITRSERNILNDNDPYILIKYRRNGFSSIEEFKAYTLKECNEITDLIWNLYEENKDNKENMDYLAPLIVTHNMMNRLVDNPDSVSVDAIEHYLYYVFPRL